MPSVCVCFSWWSRSSGRNGEGCGSLSVFHHILVVNLVNIEDGLGGSFELNPEVDIVPVVSCLPKLLVGHDICVETGYIGNVFELEQLLACRRVDLDMDLAIALHVGTAIAGKDRIGPIELLVGRRVESIEIVIDIKR